MIIAICCGLLASAGAASATATVRVVNAAGGVFWRSDADWNTAIRTVGRGVYDGDMVALTCFKRGGVVPPNNNNPLWYQASIVSGRGIGSGWVNDHFLATATNQPNIPEAGVPPCNNGGDNPPPAPPPAPTPSAAVYFSPYGKDSFLPGSSSNIVNVVNSDWKNTSINPFSTSCDGSKAYKAAKAGANGRPITQLAGWSVGRVGIWYFLSKASDSERKSVANLLSIDPGTLGELSGCDKTDNAGLLLINYLKQDPSHTFVVMAGDTTADVANPNKNGLAHRGIQEIYFNPLRDYDRVNGVHLNSQVLVCNYTMPGVNPRSSTSLKKSHQTIFQGARQYIGDHPLSACPPYVPGMTYQGSWRP